MDEKDFTTWWKNRGRELARNGHSAWYMCHQAWHSGKKAKKEEEKFDITAYKGGKEHIQDG